MWCLRKNQKGETIVEVLVALAALGIVLGSCAVIVSRSSQSMQTTQERSMALGIAQGQIERIKQYVTQDPSQLATLEGHSTFCMSDGATNTVQTASAACVRAPGAQDYQIRNTVAATAFSGSYLVTSSVNFYTTSGAQTNVTLTYRIYQ